MSNLHWAVWLLTFCIAGGVALVLLLFYRFKDAKQWTAETEFGSTERRRTERRRSSGARGKAMSEAERRKGDRRQNQAWHREYQELREAVEDKVSAERDY